MIMENKSLKRYLKKHCLTKSQKRYVKLHLHRDMKSFRKEIQEDEELLKKLED